MLGLLSLILVPFSLFCYLIIKPLYDYIRDPKRLRRFHSMTPLAGITNIPFMLATARGRRYKTVYEAHKKHKIIRTGPNAVSFNDIAAVKAIYGHGTPALKDDFYGAIAGTHRHLADVQDREDHSRKRRLLAGAFAQSSIVHWEHVVADRTAALVDQYDKLCVSPETKGEDGGWVNHREWMNLFSIDAINEIGLSAGLRLLEQGDDVVDIETLDGRVYKAHYRRSLWLGHRIQSSIAFSTHWYPILEKLTQWHPFWVDKFSFDDIVIHQSRRRLARYLAGEKLDDFFSFLMEDKHGHANMLPMGEIAAECSIMMNAGSDTTGIALTNAIYLLLKHPACLARLRNELDAVLDATETVAPYDKIKHLPYLRACLDESMRLFPPNTMSVPRKTPPEGLDVMGEWIPGGTTVHCPPFTLHRDPAVFPEPEAFRPERWLEEGAKELQPYFLAFSTGARGCIGRNITYLEQTVVVATLVRRYEFELLRPDWELDHFEAFTCNPGPMPVRISRREMAMKA